MSTYMDYETASVIYDEARVADGAEEMCQIFCGITDLPLSKIRLLDAGCGTGNYAVAFLKYGVGQVILTDASEGMLSTARKKISSDENLSEDRAIFKLCKLPNLDFADNSFDVVTLMQVLHHLDTPHNPNPTLLDYPNCVSSIKRAYQLLRSGGVLLIDVMTKENLESIWWSAFCPIAAKNMVALRMSKTNTYKLLEDCGFHNIMHIVRPSACLARPEIYRQIERIGELKWRAYFSQYKLVEKSGELDSLVKIVQKHLADGTMEEFRKTVFEKFHLYGDHSFIVCRK